MNFHRIKFWYQEQKNKFIIWFEETNVFLYFCRKLTCIIIFYVLLIDIKCGIIFSLFISYFLNRYCWDILTTWFYIDYLFGIIYKSTENFQNFKNSLKTLLIYPNLKIIKNKNTPNNYKYTNFINIYILIIFVYLILNNYLININYSLCLFGAIIYLYTIKNYINNLYLSADGIINTYARMNVLLNRVKHIIIFICNNIYVVYKYIRLYLINIYIKLYSNITIYTYNYFTYLKNKLYYNIDENIKLEYRIYIYNRKLILKKIKIFIKTYLLFFLDNLEYHIILNKIFYKKKNIIKLHKIPKNTKPIKSEIELLTNQYILYAYQKLNLYFYYYINIISNLNYIYKLDFKIITKHKYLNIRKCIKLDDKITIYINKILANIYIFISIINYIISDISLSVTYLLILLKKKYILNILLIYIFIYLKKIKIFLKKYIKLILKNINIYLYLFISKTIYITLIFCYFYNKDTSIFILYNIYNDFLFDKLIYINNMYIINIFLNINFMYVLITILGLQIILYWSKTIHKLFGRYLWTMTIFPLFLESHKILYYKLLCINILSFNTFDFIFLLKYKILDLFNFKIYNIYQTYTTTLLILLIIFFIKIGAFKHIYASLLHSRWKYIKFPIIIYSIEIFRLKIIEYISLWIIYIYIKFKMHIFILKFIINLTNNNLYLFFIDFIQEFIFEIKSTPYYLIYNIFIPNMNLINFFIDLLIIYISLKWLLIYLNQYKKIDLKFIAFPLVTTEVILKYYFIYLFIYYFSQYIYIWIIDSTILWHLFRVSLISLIYLEIRVHKVPKKTMPWYFRQIIELWPSTYFNQWYTNEYLYIDQQRYIVLRFRLKTFKIGYKEIYKRCEIWNKIIILNYQKEKDKVTKQLTTFCRVMSRKENMLREINNFEYQGWYEDWQYNYHKINIYSWKLDFWDKPHMYQFKKTVFFSNIKFHFFFYNNILERYALKYMHLTYLFFLTNILDFYYTNIYIFILDIDDVSNLSRRGWKKKFFNEYYTLEDYTHLKKLKLILMSFSSGETIKTPDWIFPPMYEKQYKLEGWSMFENPEIDAVVLDWRPDLKDLN